MSLTALRIAVLDHDSTFLAFLTEALADAGYEPSVFTAGIGIHEVLRDLAPAAIILDIPDEDATSSWQALMLLSRAAYVRHIPLIVAVRDEPLAHAQVVLHGGPATVLLAKPYTLDELLDRIEDLIAIPRALSPALAPTG